MLDMVSSKIPKSALQELQQSLTQLREVRGLTMRALETRAGLSHGTVSAAFNSPRTPSVRTLTQIARALRTDPKPLFELHAQAVVEAREEKEGEAAEAAASGSSSGTHERGLQIIDLGLAGVSDYRMHREGDVIHVTLDARGDATCL